MALRGGGYGVVVSGLAVSGVAFGAAGVMVMRDYRGSGEKMKRVAFAKQIDAGDRSWTIASFHLLMGGVWLVFGVILVLVAVLTAAGIITPDL